MSDYRVKWTEDAAQTRDTLPEERRGVLSRALLVLARDPYNKRATAAVGPDEHMRKAYVAPGMVLEYMVADAVMVVVIIELFDETHYLIDEV